MWAFLSQSFIYLRYQTLWSSSYISDHRQVGHEVLTPDSNPNLWAETDRTSLQLLLQAQMIKELTRETRAELWVFVSAGRRTDRCGWWFSPPIISWLTHILGITWSSDPSYSEGVSESCRNSVCRCRKLLLLDSTLIHPACPHRCTVSALKQNAGVIIIMIIIIIKIMSRSGVCGLLLTLSLFLYLSHFFTIFSHFSARSISSCFLCERDRSWWTLTAAAGPISLSSFPSLPFPRVQSGPEAHPRWRTTNGYKKTNRQAQKLTQTHNFSDRKDTNKRGEGKDVLHEAEAVDDFVETVVGIFPGVDLHPALPALQTHTHTHTHTLIDTDSNYLKHVSVCYWTLHTQNKTKI